MDNFQIDITAQGKPTLETALRIAFEHNHGPAKGYRIDPEKGLIFLWVVESRPGVVPFPFAMDAVGAADFAWRWLAEQDYGPEPDHDGDNGKGWRVYCEFWGHVGGDWRAICAVQPAWAMYGK